MLGSWAFRAEMLGSSSTTRCHPSASSWPRSNPPSYRHPASGLASSNRRRPWRIHSHGARARWRGEPTPRSGRHTRPVACGMAFAPPESCRANGPSILHMLCHDTGGGDGETGFELLDSARRSPNFGVGVSSTLSAWASLTAFRILVFTLGARRVCSCRG